MIRVGIIALAPLLLGVTMAGVTADGIYAPGSTTASPDWSGCTGVVAYWTLDDASGLDASAGSCSSGTDCDLSSNGTPSYAPGIRGNALTHALGSSLTCSTPAACAAIGDVTVLGWVSAGTGGFVVTFLASGAAATGVRVHSNTTATIATNATVSAFDDIGTDLGFLAVSFDESADTTLLCGGAPPSLTCTTATGQTVPNSTGIDSFCFPVGNGGDCDEMALFDVPLSQAEICKICSCWLDGSNCTRNGSEWITVGYRDSHCGGCTLPSDASTACFG